MTSRSENPGGFANQDLAGTMAMNINDAGEITGNYTDASNLTHVFLLTADAKSARQLRHYSRSPSRLLRKLQIIKARVSSSPGKRRNRPYGYWDFSDFLSYEIWQKTAPRTALRPSSYMLFIMRSQVSTDSLYKN